MLETSVFTCLQKRETGGAISFTRLGISRRACSLNKWACLR